MSKTRNNEWMIIASAALVLSFSSFGEEGFPAGTSTTNGEVDSAGSSADVMRESQSSRSTRDDVLRKKGQPSRRPTLGSSPTPSPTDLASPMPGSL